MPTALGAMNAQDVARLREWQVAMKEAEYDERLREMHDAMSGSDLYERTLIDMNDSRCDYHCRTVFKLPLALVRRRRTLLGRLLNKIGGRL